MLHGCEGLAATAAVSLLVIVAPIDGVAYAQSKATQHPAMPAAPAARPAPPPRPAMPPAAIRQAPPPAAMRAMPQPRISHPAVKPHIARPAPQIQRPPPAPRIAAPSRPPSPRITAPTKSSAPALQHAAPSHKAAGRPEVEPRARQGIEQRIDRAQETKRTERLTRSQQRELRQLERSAQQQKAAGERLQRLEARSKDEQLGQNEQRELRRLQRSEQRQKSAAQRLQQLQARSESGQLNRKDLNELRRLERREQLQKSAAQRLEQLETRSKSGQLDRAEQRELRQLERQQRALGFDKREFARERPGIETGRPARVTPQEAIKDRFAAGIEARKEVHDHGRLKHHPPRAAWRRGLHAHHVPWISAVYWPYAYSDVFYYTFWPKAYEEGYWAYVYDDFFDGIYFPYGAPHVDYAYAGPYGTIEGGTIGSAPSRQRTGPGRVSQAVRMLCAQPDEGVTAWPIAEIEEAVQPSGEQKGLLDDLKEAADAAAADFRQACPESVPMTPPGRLQAMSMRLQATLDAVKTVRPALEDFYASLSDEQKARFNEIRPELKDDRTATAPAQDRSADCDGEKTGLSALPIDEIDRVVQPTDAQAKALERLEQATQRAVGILNDACPTSTPETPVGRLDVMQERLEAMIEAANSVRPALEDFYAGLSDEQKAKFNRLGRDSARRG